MYIMTAIISLNTYSWQTAVFILIKEWTHELARKTRDAREHVTAFWWVFVRFTLTTVVVSITHPLLRDATPCAITLELILFALQGCCGRRKIHLSGCLYGFWI